MAPRNGDRRGRGAQDDPKDVGALARVGRAGTDADGVYAHHRHWAPLAGERRQQRRTGRRAQLPLAAREDGRTAAGEDGQDRRHRNGQRAVRRLHSARAEGNGTDDDASAWLEQPQSIQRGGAADHVGEGVEGADFVQVNLLHVLAVNRRLSFTQQTQHILGEAGDRRCQ